MPDAADQDVAAALDSVRAIRSPSRQEAYEKVQWALAGYTVPDALSAVTDSLAAAVGFASDSPEEADALIDSLAAHAKRSLRENWGYLQNMKRAAAAPPAGQA